MKNLNVKEIRGAIGVSQEAMADLLGVHIRTVQNWESGGRIPQTKSLILQDMADHPAKYRKTDNDRDAPLIGHQITAPINVYASDAVDKLLDAIAARDASLARAQEHIAALIEIIKNK